MPASRPAAGKGEKGAHGVPTVNRRFEKLGRGLATRHALDRPASRASLTSRITREGHLQSFGRGRALLFCARKFRLLLVLEVSTHLVEVPNIALSSLLQQG